MNDTQNQSSSVDPLAQAVAELRSKGHNVWLGLPPPEEMERLRAEKAEHDFRLMKKRQEAKGRRMAQMKERAREVIRRNREEQQ